jgi:TolA-binding protein
MPDPVAIPVSVSGFTWTAAGAWASFFALVSLLVRQWIPMKKQRQTELERVIDAQATEIGRLSDRIDSLEKRMEDQRGRYEAQINIERANHEAELGLQRHATRNAKQVLWGILDLIEAAPDNAAAHAAKMRGRMKELEAAEIAESASIRGSKIIAAAKTIASEPPPPPAAVSGG